MYITSNRYTYFNVKYYDITAAGPTLLKSLFNIDITNLPKPERNIKYGNLMRENEKYKVISKILLSFNKLICNRNNGILYTTDSVISQNDIRKDTYVKSSIYNYKVQYDFMVLVVSYKNNGYIGLTRNDEVIVKGTLKQYISKTLARKLLTVGLENLQKFKLWLKRCKVKDLSVNNYVVIDGKLTELVSENSSVKIEPDREFYYRQSLQFVTPIAKWKLGIY